MEAWAGKARAKRPRPRARSQGRVWRRAKGMDRKVGEVGGEEKIGVGG